MHPVEAAAILAKNKHRMSNSHPSLLTIHEEKVLEPLAAGRSISWIATHLQIGEELVTQQLRTAASKFPQSGPRRP